MQRRLLAEQQHPAAALGSIDTFRFEEAAALAALKQPDFSGASRFTEERTPEKCFWVRRDPDL
jgi:hypothetical protein